MIFLRSLLKYFKGLLSIIALALIFGCASTCTTAISAGQSSAYKAAMAGKIAEARNLLNDGPDNSMRSFMLSCFELSEGNFSQARKYADEFVTREPYLPDGKVLRELIEQRKAYPAEPWTISYASAWKAAGSPEMTIGIYGFEIGNNEVEMASCAQAKKCEARELPQNLKGTLEELLVAPDYRLGCDSEKFIELSLSHSSPETPVPIQLVALEWIDTELSGEDTKLPKDLRTQALARRQALLEELSLKLPLNMKFPMVVILDQTRDIKEFSLRDIERIEDAVSRPRLSPLPMELYEDYLKRLIAVGVENPYWSASSDAMLPVNIWTLILRKKIRTTAKEATPEVRERLASILEKVGKAQVKHGMLIELLFSLDTLNTAAVIRSDKSAQERVKALREFAGKLVNNIWNASPSSFWPIRPLMIDSVEWRTKNEVAFYQLFADVDTPPELLQLLKD